MKENKQIYFGTVIFFNNKPGYGFISKDEGGTDIFCHFSDINCQGFKTLKKGQRVSYQIGKNHQGQPKAINVTLVTDE